jgi:hypothetical protein
MSVSSELRKLGNARTGLAHLDEFYRQIDSEGNDRGAAILATTFLERALEYALSRRLPVTSDDHFYKLFDNEGPLSTFDYKIIMASALHIIGPDTQSNLTLIKHVRNAFAHASMPILFSEKAISDACGNLKVRPNPETFRRDFKVDTPRQKFCTVCEIIAVDLTMHAASYVRVRADFVSPETMVPMVPTALP